MSDAVAAPTGLPQGAKAPATGPKLDHGIHPGGVIAFLLVLVAGLGYALYSLVTDMNAVGQSPLAIGAFVLLGLALLIALAFEFVNGFHDTANAVATVIYTHSMPPLVAVIWSGAFNFLGVMLSSGAVAYAIVTLLPVELILQVGSSAGYAMIFALLIAAILWNLGTWAFGLPNSSSHALIGSVIGVGLANQLDGPRGTGNLGRRLGAGPGRVQGAAVQPRHRVRRRRPAAAGPQIHRAAQGSLRGPQGRNPTAFVDSQPSDPDLHARVVLPWRQ